jgi:mycothiol synthase
MVPDVVDLAALLSEMRAEFPDLVFRLFRGSEDYGPMVEVFTRSCSGDGFEWSSSSEQMAAKDRLATTTDQRRHRLVVEGGGHIVGFTDIHVGRLDDGEVFYTHDAPLDPAWRAPGLRRALLIWNEAVAMEIASTAGLDGSEKFESWANFGENEWRTTLEAGGYEPYNHLLEMVRPDLEDVPDLPLPAGIEVRPAGPEHFRAIWDMAKKSMRDHRDFSDTDYSEARYEEWLKGPELQPHLWQIAWAGDEVVVTVRSFIREEENREFGRLRGHTEHIHVAREWRRKGLASALLARSLVVLREHGMAEATLDVDAFNLSGALRVYERMGFRESYHFAFFRKPMTQPLD